MIGHGAVMFEGKFDSKKILEVNKDIIMSILSLGAFFYLYQTTRQALQINQLIQTDTR